MDTVRAFHAFNFKCLGLVCDCASSNLAVIKRTTSSSGIYPSLDDTMVPCSREAVIIDPSFQSPCDYRIRIHWVVCPSHQDMYARELRRAESNKSRMVPRLQKAHIVRDAWTKLNVTPARIMIQEHVIAELNSYIHPASGPKPKDEKNVTTVINYLTAVQKLFDFGLLSKRKLQGGDSEVVLNIRHGLTYFYDWLKDLVATKPDFMPSEARQKMFLSWQTWDLLRVAAYGFIGLQAEFASHCPGDYFYPVKVNGSSVEALFSQMKFSSAGKLSGANYAHARRNLLMKSDVHGPRSSRGDYRKAPLAVANEELQQVKKKKRVMYFVFKQLYACYVKSTKLPVVRNESYFLSI